MTILCRPISRRAAGPPVTGPRWFRHSPGVEALRLGSLCAPAPARSWILRAARLARRSGTDRSVGFNADLRYPVVEASGRVVEDTARRGPSVPKPLGTGRGWRAASPAGAPGGKPPEPVAPFALAVRGPAVPDTLPAGLRPWAPRQQGWIWQGRSSHGHFECEPWHPTTRVTARYGNALRSARATSGPSMSDPIRLAMARNAARRSTSNDQPHRRDGSDRQTPCLRRALGERAAS